MKLNRTSKTCVSGAFAAWTMLWAHAYIYTLTILHFASIWMIYAPHALHKCIFVFDFAKLKKLIPQIRVHKWLMQNGFVNKKWENLVTSPQFISINVVSFCRFPAPVSPHHLNRLYVWPFAYGHIAQFFVHCTYWMTRMNTCKSCLWDLVTFVRFSPLCILKLFGRQTVCNFPHNPQPIVMAQKLVFLLVKSWCG